ERPLERLHELSLPRVGARRRRELRPRLVLGESVLIQLADARLAIAQAPKRNRYPVEWLRPSPYISHLMSPSGPSLRTSNSTRTSGGRRALSQSGLFPTPGEYTWPSTIRHWPPFDHQASPRLARSNVSLEGPG